MNAAAFSLVEVLLAVALISIVSVSLYAGFAGGFAMVQVARENLRATQVLAEKMETIRLYTWEQINSTGFIPTNFTVPFNPLTNGQVYANAGLLYTGKVSIASSGLGESYSTNMKRITVQLNWNSGSTERKRQMETFVSRYGLQNYVY
jgi:prepilin-type N-terminal cleavage/methylation domain-containing protein